jgi:hypothetical protein
MYKYVYKVKLQTAVVTPNRRKLATDRIQSFKPHSLLNHYEEFLIISNDEIKKEKRKVSAQKAAQTRKVNKEKKNSEISNLHVKAMTNSDLFGNKNSKEEQDAALSKLKTMRNK